MSVYFDNPHMMTNDPVPVILATDLGTSGMKVALITAQGKVLGWCARPIQLHLTADGGVEQSPEEWWQAFLSAASRAS